MQTLKVDLFTLCDFALTSQEGKLSVIGMFDRIFVRDLPAQYSRFFVVAVITGQPEAQAQVSLKLEGPEDKTIIPARSIKINLGSNGRANLITDIINLNLSQTGTYHLILSSENKSLAKFKLHVTRVSTNSPQSN